MRRSILVALIILTTATFASASGQLVDGVMTVRDLESGERVPFFPLGSWTSGATIEEVALLGMNTAFIIAPATPEQLASSRQYLRDCAAHGIYVMPYLSFGGRTATEGWAPDAVRIAGQLTEEPNVLAWNVGDDIYMPGLPAIRRTVDILREIDPTIPTIADCAPGILGAEEARWTFDEYIDISMNYDYPIPDAPYPLPGNAFRKHQAFFDSHRQMLGDPLWTWTQTYMWHWTGEALNLSPEGTGPYPEPEQVRLLVQSEINRNVRGLLCFSHREILLQPKLAAEVALIFREIGLFNDHLAAGSWTGSLPTSDPEVDAASFTHGEETVVSVAILGERYQHWVDEAVLTDLTVDVPWDGARLPAAHLVATPDIVECHVERINEGHIRLTIPRLEVAGFILLTTDAARVDWLRESVAGISEKLRSLIVPGAFNRIQEVNQVVWQSGAFNLQRIELSHAPVNAGMRSSHAIAEGRYEDGVREWRSALRLCRVAIDSVMRSVRSREHQLHYTELRHLRTPYGLHNIPGLAQAPPINDSWRFIRGWNMSGPYDLLRDQTGEDGVCPGFHVEYAPETGEDARWRPAVADVSGRLDFLPRFSETNNVIGYARCRVIAPHDMEVRFSLGSNDGAKVFVNGEEVFFYPAPVGRKGKPHQNEFTVNLRKGDNNVLAKVANFGANWKLYLAVDDPERVLVFEPY